MAQFLEPQDREWVNGKNRSDDPNQSGSAAGINTECENHQKAPFHISKQSIQWDATHNHPSELFSEGSSLSFATQDNT